MCWDHLLAIADCAPHSGPFHQCHLHNQADRAQHRCLRVLASLLFLCSKSCELAVHLEAPKINRKNESRYRSIKISYRQTFSLGEIYFQLQIQNRAARRMNFFDYKDRSLGMSAESLSLQIQILSGNPNYFPLQIQISGAKRIDSVIISATTVYEKVRQSI